MLRHALHILIGLAAITALAHASEEKDSYSLTIYSKASPGSISPDSYRPLPGGVQGYHSGSAIPGYAVIRQSRPMELTAPRSRVTFSNVAAYIDPTTVMFSSLSYPKQTHVIEQNYLFDLVNKNKVLERYIDKKISVEQIVGDSIESYKGILLSAQGGLVLKDDDDKILTLNSYSNIRFPELPGGLITEPTLLWDIATDKSGKHDIQISYQTGGITWWSDYNMIFKEGKNANSGILDISAWVSIINQSGSTYENAELKLMAGDVQRATPQNQVYRGDMMMATAEKSYAPGFKEKAFFEYHLYTLGRPTTLPNNTTKQLELFKPVTHIPAEKLLIYNGQQNAKKIGVFLKFANTKNNGMGMPLPAGRIRVSKRDDSDSSLEFIGEDIIDHTPKDENIKVKLGNAFDVIGERKQIQYRTDSTRKTAEETIEVTLRNHKDTSVNVTIEENLQRYKSWKVLRKSHDYEKESAYKVNFPVTLPKDGKATMRYTVKYTW